MHFPGLSFLTCACLTLGPIGLSDEPKTSPANNVIRSNIQPYIDWVPDSSESLVVVDKPYRIPQERPLTSTAFDVDFREFHLAQMFDKVTRQSLVGKTINLWIGAGSQFRLPEFPKEPALGIPDCTLHYDGCQIIVFDAETPLDVSTLFASIMGHDADAVVNGETPQRRQLGGYDTVEYVATHIAPQRTRRSQETPEVSKKIDDALAVRYWITSPSRNVLIVATSQAVFSETLRRIGGSAGAAFPVTLPEWAYFTGQPRVWGMRHFQDSPRATDYSDFRGTLDLVTSGFAFEIDSERDTARLTFVHCGTKSAETLRSYAGALTDAVTEVTSEPAGTLVADLNWSKPSPQVKAEVETQLAYWLVTHVGHAVML